MKQIAFYAPLKSPHHPVPSGDREIAQSILIALRMNTMGLKVKLASQLRCYDGEGSMPMQKKIRALADVEVQRILDTAEDWQAWVTYHNYYKAPDLIGHAVCQQLKIPYLLIEASIAKSRLNGPWSGFAASADAATHASDIIFYLTEKDRVALELHRPGQQQLIHLAPFLNQKELPQAPAVPRNNKHLLSVGMLRYGDKLASYQIIADSLKHLDTPDWQLSIVGDGPARSEIESMFASFGEQVRFLGLCDRAEVNQAYQRASVFFWPGVNEAFGMVYLEAQAMGLPVVAQDRAGVREVIATAESLVPVDDSQGLARKIDRLLSHPAECQSMAQAGLDFISKQHLLGSASATLSTHLSRVLQ